MTTLKRSACAITVDVESDIPEVNFTDIDELCYLLEMFKDQRICCTFFFTGRFVEKMPDLVNSVRKNGHEVAFHGYAHESWKRESRAKIQDLQRLNALLQSLNIHSAGFRAPFLAIDKEILWHLREMGFRYDSSTLQTRISKIFRLFSPYTYNIAVGQTEPAFLTEIPISTIPILGFPYTLNWLSIFGASMYKALIPTAQTERLLVFYMHPYDILCQPKRFGIPAAFRGLTRRDSKKVLQDFLMYLSDRNYKFVKLIDEL